MEPIRIHGSFQKDTLYLCPGQYVQIYAGDSLIEFSVTEEGEARLYVEGVEARPMAEHPADAGMEEKDDRKND